MDRIRVSLPLAPVSRWAHVLLQRRKLILFGVMVVLLAGVAYLVADEMRTSRWQAHYLAQLGREFGVRMGAGRATSIRYPKFGPYDEQLGYVQLPRFLAALEQAGYRIDRQARWSPRLLDVTDRGLFTPYAEKPGAGLTVLDAEGRPLFSTRYPERVYSRFEAIPSLLVRSLLFIENRELLDDRYPTRNPAVEWDRFSRAVLDQALHKIAPEQPAPGGSTLATQIEKFRHSPGGRTNSIEDKLRQMASASLRAYRGGEDTRVVRRQIVLDYVNTVPLGAKSGYGAVNGLGDGLAVWFGRDFEQVNRLLQDGAVHPTSASGLGSPGGASVRHRVPDPWDWYGLDRRVLDWLSAHPTDEPTAARALAFKQALSLFIAQRRPAYYLQGNAAALESLAHSYLRLLADGGVISPRLRDLALAQPLGLQEGRLAPPAVSFVDRKAATATRVGLLGVLRLPRLYDLDHLDLIVSSTLDKNLQRAVTQVLHELRDPARAKAAGLVAPRLLDRGDPAKVIYSFTLYERGNGVNRIRAQTDNYDQPFDINQGTKLDLGSTAKLRTLVTYLEIVAALHQRDHALDAAVLKAAPVAPQDAISRWARDYLATATDRSLWAMLEAAMERKYSASPAETFFTGGGNHTFDNFNPDDDTRVLTVREGLRNSVNLVFVRLLRDIAHYYTSQGPGGDPALLRDVHDPRRRAYLERFADRESRVFLLDFYRKYQGKAAAAQEALLLSRIRPTPRRLAAIFRSIEPDAGLPRFTEFLRQHLHGPLPADPVVARLYQSHSAERFNLADRAYIAGMHPLELWLVGYLRQHPQARWAQLVQASRTERIESYSWLYSARRKAGQDSRIRQILEEDAFRQIHARWKRLGYPFDSLVPSYATTLGASADRPAALAELMGILLNDGVRQPTVHIEHLHFAPHTPYETQLSYRSHPGERVLPAEIARVARETLAEVVDEGTARRLRGAFVNRDGTPLAVGGKTGTGDHRYDVYGKGGALISSKVISRSGTFVFFLGERYFGTLTAYVQGPEAARYGFTSGLPVQIMKVLAPTLAEQLHLAGGIEP